MVEIIAKYKKSTLVVMLFLFVNSIVFAQNDTIYFDANWKECSKELAEFYRIPRQKIKISEAVECGCKTQTIDSVYVVEDYYAKSKKIQFRGYSKDIAAGEIIGQRKWFDTNGKEIQSNTYNFNDKSVFSKWNWQPIFYANYSITVKSQFTAGMEFCLSCEKDSKANLFLGLGYGITSYDDKYTGLPDAYLSLNTDNLYFVKIGGSNRNLYSLVGLSLLNMVDVGCGYSYPLTQDETPELKGFTFGITFRITNNQKAYVPIRVGF